MTAGNRWSWALRLALGLAVLASCDARATATDPHVAAPRGEQKSREYESCGATVHCADELRCFEQVCQRTARSVVGDYQIALGAALQAQGKLAEAVAAHAAAVARYEADKLAVPPDVDCAYGAVLAASRSKKEQSELAARVLHRCLVALPVGSSGYRRALAELASLADTGLDAEALGKGTPADVYLSRGPARKAASSVTIAASASPMPTGKTFPLLLERIGSEELRPALLACWEAHAKNDELVVTLPLRTKYIEEYEDEPGVTQVTLEGAGAAEDCVRTALEPLKKTPGLRDTSSTKLTVTMK